MLSMQFTIIVIGLLFKKQYICRNLKFNLKLDAVDAVHDVELEFKKNTFPILKFYFKNIFTVNINPRIVFFN